MILYFADRQFNILGQASTKLPEGLTISDDLKSEDVETGVAVFDCKIHFDDETRSMVKACTATGNYVLRLNGNENELYTIIDREKDTKKQTVYIYAEDAGMDLLNEVVGAYAADQAYPISHYINKYAAGAGFQIGVNEAADLSRKLSWDGESTATERIASVANQFDGCEVSYTFEVDGLFVTKKYINIYKKRGQDIGVTLRLNQDIDRIITTESIANLATALQCTGGTPEDTNVEDDIDPVPITLDGYKYDDGDFYVDGGVLKSREALKTWSRYLWKSGTDAQAGGHITKQFSYDTLSQSELCNRAIADLKKRREIEINYEVEFSRLPENAKIGDRVNIVDDADELYLSTRLLKIESSVCDETQTAVLGEHLIKSSGISQKVADLAAQFAKMSVSAARALMIANTAKANAEDAKAQVDEAIKSVEEAQKAVEEVADVVEEAKASAAAAQEAADNAQAVVDSVEEKIESLETTVNNAQAAADNARAAAETAQQKADEAKQAADNAAADAGEAKESAAAAQTAAGGAVEKAEAAQDEAEAAKATAESASATAAAAKADAEQAEKDVAALGEDLTTLSQTMEADYTRKTEFTETTADLQSQITQNAAQIQSTVSKVTEIDETANNAATQAATAQSQAAAAQTKADQATADAEAAQNAADAAAQAAASAQSEADTAKAAAEAAQSVADKAEADLAAAQADLATVSGRVDATEEEIAAAQQAVEAAQAAADKAKADADTAAEKAAAAQETANTAVEDASNAQQAANDAASQAAAAQKTAEEAKGDAAAAQKAADEAAATAAEAQRAAADAVTNAENAQAAADQAAADAAAAQAAANDADAKADQAAADLAAAQQNLADVTSRVDATEEEVAAAQAAVDAAQTAADVAQAEAAAAQAAADQAAADAAAAQSTADTAKEAADNAQIAADEAQKAADKAQEDVDALAVRVTTAETRITQNAEQIELRATKTELTETLGGYSTKEETAAAIQIESDSIKSSVTAQIEGVQIGGRNFAQKTSEEWSDTTVYQWSGGIGYYVNGSDRQGKLVSFEEIGLSVGDDFTIGIDLNAINKSIKLRVDLYRGSTLGENYYSYGTEAVEIGTSKRVVYTRSVTEEFPYFAIYVGNNDTTDATETVEQYKCLKIEKGNKATDWTPAPEDMATAEDAENAQASADAAQTTAADAESRVSVAESTIQQLADMISTLVTDGNGVSLMTQTENGWTFSTAAIQESVESTAEGLGELSENLDSVEAAVDALDSAVQDLGVIAEYITIGSYTYTEEDGTEQTVPSIDLGETDSEFKLKITNRRILFTNGDEVIVRIDSETNSLHIGKAVVETELQIGGIVIKKRANGNVGFTWKGVS